MWAHDFRVFFTPLFEVLFTFPSRYSFTIGLSGVFSLTGWAPLIHTGFLVSRATQVPTRIKFIISCKGLSPALVQLSICFYYDSSNTRRRPYYTDMAATISVWAAPRSLATTYGITFVFFSYGYLDVSVPRVRSTLLRRVTIACDGFPHSDICGSSRICQ